MSKKKYTLAKDELEELKCDEILKLWEKESSEEIDVYIHSPFCKSLCKYCIYGATTLKNYYELDYYYNDYLTRQLKFYNEVFQNKFVNQLYFGGGTPNLMSASHLNNIFKTSPYLNTATNKIIEIHPCYITEDFLETIIEKGFHKVIIGVQTFNGEILTSQNREPSRIEDVEHIIRKMKENNIIVAVDLIGFLDNNNRLDIKTISNDLVVMKKLKPDIISYSVLFEEKFDFVTDSELIDFYRALNNFSKQMEYIFDFNELNNNTSENLDTILFVLYSTKNVRLFSKNSRVTTFLNAHSLNDYFLSCEDNPVLGIGSYNNSRFETFSKVNSTVYIEINDNHVAKYYRTYYGGTKSDLLENFYKNVSKSHILLNIDNFFLEFNPSKYRLKGKNNMIIYNTLEVTTGDKILDSYLKDILNPLENIELKDTITSYFPSNKKFNWIDK